jgi:hypothetical protein
MVASLGLPESSRRSLFMRLFGGWLALALSALGIGGLTGEDAEAKKKGGGGKKARRRCRRRQTSRQCRRCCNKRRRRSRRGCLTRKGCTGAAGKDNSTPITFDIDLLNTPCTVGGNECGTGTGLECVGLVCVPRDEGDPCQKDSDCRSGQCNENSKKCVPCTEVCGDPGDEVCCAAGTKCATNRNECVVQG